MRALIVFLLFVAGCGTQVIDIFLDGSTHFDATNFDSGSVVDLVIFPPPTDLTNLPPSDMAL